MMNKFLAFFTFLVFTSGALKSQTQNDTIFNYITKTPVTIDGKATEECWANAEWHDIHQVLIPYGANMDAGDFEGKYKVAWDEEYLYVLVEVVDDSLSDNFSNPLQNWWDDDCVEIFIDENRSKGNHERNFNAFAYHVSLFYDAIDLNSSGGADNYKDNIEVVMDTIGENTYLWELAIKNYSASFDIDNPEASRVKLVPNKLTGFAIAYCDNDGNSIRENFIGSMTLTSATANDLYKNADHFGTMLLIDPDYVEPLKLSLNSPINVCIGESAIIDAGLGFTSYQWSNNVTDTSRIEVSNAGIYSVTITDEFGASASDTVEVIIRELPIINLGSDITHGGSLELDAGTGFASYNWSNDSETQTITVTESGEYWVQVSNIYNCFGADTINIIITNISDKLSTHINIYPNPTKSQINISTSANGNEITTYTLSAITGQVLKSGTFIGNSKIISIKDLNAGIYLLKTNLANTNYSTLIIKE